MKPNNAKIIVVARDTSLANRIRHLPAGKNWQVFRESSIDHVLERFESDAYDVLIITNAAFKAGEANGIELLEVITANSPATEVLFIVEPRDVRVAMSALEAGAYQYAKLPVSDEELGLLVEAALAKRPEGSRRRPLKKRSRKSKMGKLTGRSPKMQEVYRQIRVAAATDIPVLLSGETGTGKDLAAQAIHQQSDRKDGPFVPVHLGAIPTDLVASELFGHEKGAFTGAEQKRTGKFEQAHEGTVFLDEISTVDEKVQISLLRLIERKKFNRLGGQRTISSNARLIVASNQNLGEVVGRGAFREDLYYRLNVFNILLPPLRERQGDIPLLIDEFLKHYNSSYQKNVQGIAPGTISVLESYGWPGNVRELKNVIQRAVLVCTGEAVLPEHLPPRFRPDRQPRPRVTFEVGTPLHEVEREMIINALAAVKNNRKRAAELLGISRRALYNKLGKYSIK